MYLRMRKEDYDYFFPLQSQVYSTCEEKMTGLCNSQKKMTELFTFLSSSSSLPFDSVDSGAEFIRVLPGSQVKPPGRVEDPF